jgi:hypothetical protein
VASNAISKIAQKTQLMVPKPHDNAEIEHEMCGKERCPGIAAILNIAQILGMPKFSIVNIQNFVNRGCPPIFFLEILKWANALQGGTQWMGRPKQFY